MATASGLPAYDALRGMVNLLQPATNYFPNLHGTADSRRQMPATKSHVRRKGAHLYKFIRGCEGAISLHAAVHVFPVSHLHYEDEQGFIPNLINDAVVLPRPNIDAIELLLGLHLHHSMRAWILFEAENVPVDLLSDVGIELAKVPLSGGSDFHAVGQESVSKFPHEVAKRNGSLLFRLFQGGAGVFEIDSVHAGWLDAGFPA